MFELEQRPALEGVAEHGDTLLEVLAFRSVASVVARRGKAEQLAAKVADAYDVTLPEGPQWTGGPLAFIGVGPDSWLAVSARADLAQELQRDLAGLASVADQSSAYARIRLSGAGAIDILAKHVILDLHPETFKPGDAAVTNFGSINVVLWKVDDLPTFEFATFRSYAKEMWRDFNRSLKRCSAG